MKLEVQKSETHDVNWLEDEDTRRTVCDFYCWDDEQPDGRFRFENAEQNAKDIAHRYNVHDELVKALRKITLVCGGEEMSKRALIHALELSVSALKKATGVEQ